MLEPSQAFRSAIDYWSQAKGTRESLLRFSALAPTTLACMHGSAFTGDGAGILRALAETFEA